MTAHILASVTDGTNQVDSQSQRSPAASEIRKIAAARSDERSNQRQRQVSDEKRLTLEQLVEEVDQLLKQPEMSTTPMKKQPVFQSVLE